MGLIPNYTKAETKVIWGLTFQRILTILFSVLLAFALSDYIVHRTLTAVFIITSCLFAVILTSKDTVNPIKTKWRGILIMFRFYARPKRYRSLFTIAFDEAIRAND